MWRFKSCPKCRGDLYVENDLSGWYEECLQCGYVRDLSGVRPLNSPRRRRLRRANREVAFAGERG